MPLVADRVAETTTTTGTGTVTLAGAKAGYQAFTTAFSTGAKVYYCITDNTDWEVGVGTFTTAGTTLSRDSVFASSNAGAAVNWGAGSKDVFCTAPTQTIVGAPIFQNKTGAYTVVASDNGTIINCTSGTFTVSLTAAATLGSGFNCWIWNTGSGSITIDPSGSETIDTKTTKILRQGEGTQVICDGTNWRTGDKKAMRGYAENVASGYTNPNASGDPSVAIGDGAEATGSYNQSFGYTARATGILAATAIGYAPTASGNSSLAIGRSVTASSSNSCAIGQNSSTQGSQAVTGSGAMSLGGSYASGTDSFAAAVANNTSSYGATGAYSVAIGRLSKATSTETTAIGVQASVTNNRAVALGNLAIASGIGSVCIAATAGGYGATASGTGSVAIGERIQAAQVGKYAYGSGAFSATGDAQAGHLVLRIETTGTTPTVLTTDNTAPGNNDQVILPNNSAYAFTGLVVARQQASGGTASAAWKIEGLIRREANAASTTLVASTVTAIDNTPGWTLALSADTTNGGLAITATGAAATNIRWVATVQTSEVTYA